MGIVLRLCGDKEYYSFLRGEKIRSDRTFSDSSGKGFCFMNLEHNSLKAIIRCIDYMNEINAYNNALNNVPKYHYLLIGYFNDNAPTKSSKGWYDFEGKTCKMEETSITCYSKNVFTCLETYNIHTCNIKKILQKYYKEDII